MPLCVVRYIELGVDYVKDSKTLTQVRLKTSFIYLRPLSTVLSVILALSSSGGAENAHAFPFSLSYLTCLRPRRL